MKTAVLSLSIVGVLFLLLGWLGSKIILELNPCQMTYSIPSLEIVPICCSTSSSKFKLWKHKSQTKDVINKIPVLFIPGNSGRLDTQILFLIS